LKGFPFHFSISWRLEPNVIPDFVCQTELSPVHWMRSGLRFLPLSFQIICRLFFGSFGKRTVPFSVSPSPWSTSISDTFPGPYILRRSLSLLLAVILPTRLPGSICQSSGESAVLTCEKSKMIKVRSSCVMQCIGLYFR